MTHRPRGWVVPYRLRWYERLLLGYGALIGLFFAVVCFGGLAVVVSGSLDGTLLPPGHRSAIAIAKYAAIALFALWFGTVSLRWAFGSLADLVGAEVVLYGPVETLSVHRGAKGRTYSAIVAGETVALGSEVFGTLATGDPVWMRVGRFQRSLKELARPDRIAPPMPTRPGASAGAATPPAAPAIKTTLVAGPRIAAKGAIADAALRRSDVPAPTAPWTEVERFALTYAGATGPALSDLLERHAQAGTQPETLGELRAILYLEQRRHRHAGRAPWGEALTRVRAIVEAIRARLPEDD